MDEKRVVFTPQCMEQFKKYSINSSIIINKELAKLEQYRYGTHTIRLTLKFRLLSYIYKYKDIQWLVGLNIVKHDNEYNRWLKEDNTKGPEYFFKSYGNVSMDEMHKIMEQQLASPDFEIKPSPLLPDYIRDALITEPTGQSLFGYSPLFPESDERDFYIGETQLWMDILKEYKEIQTETFSYRDLLKEMQDMLGNALINKEDPWELFDTGHTIKNFFNEERSCGFYYVTGRTKQGLNLLLLVAPYHKKNGRNML